MTLTYKASSTNRDFLVPPGSYAAVCDIVADVGLQPGSVAFPDPKQQVYIRFEIPSERVEYRKDGRKLNGPAVIGQFFTASMNEKANLRKLLQQWRGTTLTDEEAEIFDVSKILGKPCLLTVVENRKGDKVYSNIGGVGPLPKGMQAPIAEMEPLLYCDNNSATYSSLPEWLRKRIDAQLIKEQPQTQPDHSPGYEPLEITDEDIPF
jgi:hypothetical protein